jgi:hypothetical protein
MKISMMRFLDQGVAGAVCALASPVAWLLRKLHRPDPSRPIRRILFLKFFGLGSLTRAAPLFLSLRRSLPESTLTIVTFRENGPLLERLGVFDRVLAIDSGSAVAMAGDLLRCLGHLAFSRYDAVLDMEFFSNFSSNPSSVLSAMRSSLGYGLRTIMSSQNPLSKPL